eukprot:GILI01017981.1.p1 GENE.GILI01017981.1~~GILI01017981.1.p1  ORF type:complete len:180 (-),score=23.85 GILI01017981.1:126-665(-)
MSAEYPQPNKMTSPDRFFAKAEEAAAVGTSFDIAASAAGRVILSANESIPKIHQLLRQPTVDLADLEAELDLGNVNARSPRGKTPLMTAAYYGHKRALERLLDRGSVIDALHELTGDTAAHFVCLSPTGNIRQSGCMMVLIENGASIDRRNDDGFTVFELARKNGNRDIGATGDALMHS